MCTYLIKGNGIFSFLLYSSLKGKANYTHTHTRTPHVHLYVWFVFPLMKCVPMCVKQNTDI